MSPADRAKAVVSDYMRGTSGNGRLPRLVTAALVAAENEALELAAKLADVVAPDTRPATLADRIRLLKHVG